MAIAPKEDSKFLEENYRDKRYERTVKKQARQSANVEAFAKFMDVKQENMNPAIHGKLMDRIKHSRGIGHSADTRFGKFLKYVNKNMYEHEKKKGAFLKLSFFEGKIRLRGAEGGDGPLGVFIHGRVTEDKAETVIQMASLKGWRDMKLHGNEKEKEKFWIALKRQDMRERIEFQKGLENGTVPKTIEVPGPDGQPMEVPNEYEPLTCNFEPTPGSGMMKKWEAEQSGWEKQLQAVGGSMTPPATPTLSVDDIVAKQKQKMQEQPETPAAPEAESSADAIVDALRNTAPRGPGPGM